MPRSDYGTYAVIYMCTSISSANSFSADCESRMLGLVPPMKKIYIDKALICTS